MRIKQHFIKKILNPALIKDTKLEQCGQNINTKNYLDTLLVEKNANPEVITGCQEIKGDLIIDGEVGVIRDLEYVGGDVIINGSLQKAYIKEIAGNLIININGKVEKLNTLEKIGGNLIIVGSLGEMDYISEINGDVAITGSVATFAMARGRRVRRFDYANADDHRRLKLPPPYYYENDEAYSPLVIKGNFTVHPTADFDYDMCGDFVAANKKNTVREQTIELYR